MYKSFLAGVMITIGAAVFLTVGGVTGSILFSIGLLTILYFQYELFTGKAGLLAQKKIEVAALCKIFCGNLLGCAFGVGILCLAGLAAEMREPAFAIVTSRINNMWYENIFRGIICGVLMYIAVNEYKDAPYVTIMCIATFILLGANHCVADMAYLMLGLVGRPDNWLAALLALGYTIIGNIIGCNLLPLCHSSK